MVQNGQNVSDGGNRGYDIDGNSATSQRQMKDSIILDTIQIIYGANNQDATNPTVSVVQVINSDSSKTEIANGKLTTDVLTKVQDTYILYAQDDAGRQCYPLVVASYEETGQEGVVPYKSNPQEIA